jgi:uncharacterized membrane protein
MSATASDSGPIADDLQLVLPPKSTPAGEGVNWIGAGWRLFAKAPLMWVVSMLVLFVLAIVVNLIPIIGSLAWQILSPVFTAGFMVACRALERGGEFEIEHLLAGFKTNFVNLMIVGFVFLLAWVAIFAVVALFVGFGVFMAVMGGNPNDVYPAIAASGMSILVGVLVMLLLLVPLLMAYWFAPALVILHNMAPLGAMKASFSGCLRNLIPFLVYGLVMMLACIVAVIPFGLGMLVWVPVAITSTYAAYRAIFTEEAAPTVPARKF